MSQLMKHVIKNNISKSHLRFAKLAVNILLNYNLKYLHCNIFVEHPSPAFKLIRMP